MVRGYPILPKRLHRFMQKDTPSRWSGQSFCRPIFQSGDFYRVGAEIFQVVKKTSVWCQTVTEQAP